MTFAIVQQNGGGIGKRIFSGTTPPPMKDVLITIVIEIRDADTLLVESARRESLISLFKMPLAVIEIQAVLLTRAIRYRGIPP